MFTVEVLVVLRPDCVDRGLFESHTDLTTPESVFIKGLTLCKVHLVNFLD